MNRITGNMLSGLDNRAGKIRIELQWHTDSSQQGVSEFLYVSADTNAYSTLTWTNCFMRNKYEIVNQRYISKEPIFKPLFLLERQLVTSFSAGTEKILKLDDIFSARKKALAVVILQRKSISAYNDADAMKGTIPYSLNYKIYQNGREVKNRTEPQTAVTSNANWLKSIDGLRLNLADAYTSYVPWFAGVVPLSNLFIEDTKSDKYLRGAAYTSPAMNYEIHMTLQNPASRTSNTTVECFLLYMELAEFDAKGGVRVYT